MIGETVSHYKIIEKLGEGSRGVVYKAEDIKLGRPVALKFFPTDVKTDEEQKERFILEAKTASALDHTNICTIHEIEETMDGRLFICMAFYEGETLTGKIKEGPLKIEEVIDYSIQVARGMEKAHRKGIVHRDIKPHNLIVTNDGVVKIVDFGLAKLIGQKNLTREGISVGTVVYMSPEQARGEEVDRLTDIWSLGVVIYEMITGQLPFRGEDVQTVLHSILTKEPEPINRLRSGIPPEMERILKKCLSKECANRYQHFAELITDLSRLKEIVDMASASSKRDASRRIPRKLSLHFIVLAILSAALIITAGIFFFDKIKGPELSRAERRSITTKPSIAVLPFRNMNPEQQLGYFCDGMVEELIIALNKIEGLQVASRTTSFQFKGKNYDVREIGEKIDVKTVLAGSVRKAGSTIIITARLLSVSDGSQLWGEKYQGKLKEIYRIQEEIAGQIVDTLQIKLADEQRVSLISRYTKDIDAYTFYLRGRDSWNRRLPEDLYKGIEFFRKAIEKDPDYALAYVGFADSYHLLSTYSVLAPKYAFTEVEKAASKALEIDDNLGEAHNSLAAVKLLYEWDFRAAEREFKRAIELNPGFHTTHEWYAICLAVTNRVDESIDEMERALELEPLETSALTGLARHLYFAKKFDASIRLFRQTLEMDPNSFYAHVHLGQAYIMKSMITEAITHFRKAVDLTGGNEPGMLSGLGYAYAVSGRPEEAHKIVKGLIKLSSQRYIPAFYIAGIYIGLGDNDRAFEWLERAYIERSEWLIYLNIEYMLDPIRRDPRFAELVKKVGLDDF